MNTKTFNNLSDEKYWEKVLIDVTDWIEGYLTICRYCKNCLLK